ncbi:hypothetical protein GCM10011490_12210 [Pseudoclavibacter endophyticus]|uniref:Uncharacterized protein n=1 Tax=Pseudoclavibacter endophyticus TaxID=1778590 RepID=A0A6H9WNS1_9MICO|nr:hypothetical protein [Pseudoclavibacter endophyticus]KAB1649361.1 hypothetical protein F8O04_03585 [Pseudoclavibacter endophyticus]GGA63201.1 hypothetical protein GCM10011490_12210 [Pseudoclavibacter endophyticus]
MPTHAETSRDTATDRPNAWPGDAVTVERWLRGRLRREPGVSAALDDVHIDVELDGDDLARCHVDASGVEIPLAALIASGAGDADAAGDAGAAGDGTRGETGGEIGDRHEPPVLEARRGVARDVRVAADPLRVAGRPVWFDARVSALPVVWRLHDAPVDPEHPESDRGIDVVDDGAGATVTAEVSVQRSDLEPLVRSIIEATLAEGDGSIRLARFSLELRGSDQRDLEAVVHLGVRWGLVRGRLPLLGVTARATARFGVDPDGTLHVREVQVRSRNPLVAIPLAMPPVRRRLNEVAPRTIVLGDALGPDEGTGYRLHDVRLELGPRIRVSARLE